MNIDPIPSIKKTMADSEIIVDEGIQSTSKSVFNTTLDTETKQALDKATGLLQSIVTDKSSDELIRKMPSDEYLHLLSLLDEIISGSIDKHV